MSKKKRKSQPVTAHRMFPAIVALWFAALFGVGSFVVPPALLEKLVAATRLPALVPAAAPPLGLTARLLVGLALTAIGALAGFILARQLAQRPGRSASGAAEGRRFGLFRRKQEPSGETVAQKLRSRDRHPDAPARKPVTASEDLAGAEPFGEAADKPSAAPLRRRLLAQGETGDESFAIDDYAPLPGVDPGVDTVGTETPPFAPPLATGPAGDGHIAQDAVEADPEPVAQAGPVDDDEAFYTGQHASFAGLGIETPADAADTMDSFAAPAPFEPPVEPEAAQAGPEVAQVEPEVAGSAAPPLAGGANAVPAQPEPAPVDRPPPAATTPPAPQTSPVAGRPIEELGTVQLVERLALAIANRRDRQAARAAEPAPFQPQFDQPQFESSQAQAVASAGDEIAQEPQATFTREGAPQEACEPEDFASIAPVSEDAAPGDAYTGDASFEEAESSWEVAGQEQAASPPLEPAVPAEPAPERVVPLRPFGFDPLADADQGDEDDFAQPAQLQRFLGEASPSQAAAPVQPGARFDVPPPAAGDAEEEDDSAAAAAVQEEEVEGDEDGTESHFSSLLDMKSAAERNEFVRVEEPQSGSDDGQVEPVVVFPGQAPRTAAAPFDAPPSPGVPRAPAAAAPAAAAQPAAPRPEPKGDPAETDRALRAALATLQRMTGNR